MRSSPMILDSDRNTFFLWIPRPSFTACTSQCSVNITQCQGSVPQASVNNILFFTMELTAYSYEISHGHFLDFFFISNEFIVRWYFTGIFLRNFIFPCRCLINVDPNVFAIWPWVCCAAHLVENMGDNRKQVRYSYRWLRCCHGRQERNGSDYVITVSDKGTTERLLLTGNLAFQSLSTFHR